MIFVKAIFLPGVCSPWQDLCLLTFFNFSSYRVGIKFTWGSKNRSVIEKVSIYLILIIVDQFLGTMKNWTWNRTKKIQIGQEVSIHEKQQHKHQQQNFLSGLQINFFKLFLKQFSHKLRLFSWNYVSFLVNLFRQYFINLS